MRNPAYWMIYLLVLIGLTVGVAAAQPGSVSVVVNRDDVNIRLLPAIGAEVIGHVNAGTTFQPSARTADNEWLRVDLLGNEAWVGSVVVTVLSGDVNSLPVADPRSIPYGGLSSPRAGRSSASGPIQGRLDDNGVRLRSGPSRAYPILANVPRLSVFPILGRAYNNAWLQINFDGTLGWITAQEVTLVGAADLNVLPIDGIVAESLPISQATAQDYLAMVRLLRDRVNLAQPALDQIRAIWTDISLGASAPCSNIPFQPTDQAIPVPLLAAYYDTLFPLQNQFNEAMRTLRDSIGLLVQSCTFPGSPIAGQAFIQQGLDFANRADSQFIALHQRLNELAPPGDTANQCAFEFEGRVDVLWRLDVGRIYVDHFTPRNRLTGYCFDAVAAQAVSVSVVPLTDNITMYTVASQFDAPTAFLATQRPTFGQTGALSFTAPVTGRYLVIVQEVGAQLTERSVPPQGDFALLVSAGTPADPTQAIDLATGGPAVGYDLTPVLSFSAGQPAPVPIAVTPGATPAITAVPPEETAFCPGLTLTCGALTCEQAQACYSAGNFLLDPDGDGFACEETCPTG